jgi:hypothetical protein
MAKKVAKRKPAARGSVTPELMAKVIAAVAAGASLRTASEQNGITHSTALEAIERHGLADQYARARDERADVLAEESLQIADVGSGDAQRDRLRLDARKWFISKLAPKKYGDKIEHAHGGINGDAIPIRHAVDLTGLTAAERAVLRPVLERIAGDGE